MEQHTTTETAASATQEQLLTFIVSGEEYGVDILKVQEIRGWTNPMPLPQAPPYIKGVINLRGSIVPIADLRERLGLSSLAYGDTTVIVVMRVGSGARERVMGVIVDAMSDVTTVPAADVRPPPDFGDGTGRSIARGIATVGEKMITILEVDRIFASDVGPTGANPGIE